MNFMEMEEYVNKNYGRLVNDFKVVKEIEGEIPESMEMQLADYISDRYNSEINYKVTKYD